MKLSKSLLALGKFLSLLILVGGLYIFISPKDFTVKSVASAPKVKKSTSQKKAEEPATETTSSESDQLPEVTADDWELILVNRENRVEELNPELAQVENITVDHRIADATINFLAAARELDANFHPISGYRSLADQEVIYQGYIEEEMANQGLTEEEATTVVQTYSQPAGASEHHTGLAIDISTVDELNQADATVMGQLQSMAADFGFILRFAEGKQDITGIGYEDWHYRYVGETNAKYMVEKGLTLEEYVSQLRGRE